MADLTTPEQPSPSVSVSRELLERTLGLMVAYANATESIDAAQVCGQLRGILTQPQQPVSARVTVERETLELVCNEIQMHADTLRPAEEFGFTVHGLDGLRSLLSGALTRSQPEAPAQALPAERWIPVDERLPEDGGLVLVWNRHEYKYAVGRLLCSGALSGPQYSFEDEYGVDLGKVTHWQPLPEPPTRLRALAGAEAGEQDG